LIYDRAIQHNRVLAILPLHVFLDCLHINLSDNLLHIKILNQRPEPITTVINLTEKVG